jgi:hypothetical protein
MRRILLLLWLLLLAAPAWAVAQQTPGPVLRTELEKDATIPGQPIVLRITLLAPTWLPKPPVFPSFETPNVIVRLPSRASSSTSERIDGETWAGVTRAYRLYPMITGQFRIPAQPVTVTYADPDTQAPVTVELATDEVVFSGVAPEGAEDLDPFIAAEALTLEQSIEGEPGNLEPGGAITRTVTVRVQGTSPIFLPPVIEPLVVPGLSAYPKEPVVSETEARGTVSGDRVESVTYVAEAGGRHKAAPIRLRWFNLRENRIETAVADGFEIAVRGPPPAAPPSSFDWRAIAPWIVLGALLVALATVVALRLWPRIARWRHHRRETYLASEAFAFNQALTALRGRDFAGSLRAIELWESRIPAGSVSDSSRLSLALAQLGAGLYGQDRHPPLESQWNTAVAALRAARQESLGAPKAGRALPPLNPRMVT